MGQTVLVVKNDIITKMKAFYIDHLADSPPPGAIFRASPLDCSITAYRSGKVLFQGKRAAEEATIWEKWSQHTGQNKPSAKPTKSVENHDYLPPSNIGDLAVVGSDEVGTGDFFGPIVVVAAYTDKGLKDRLKQLGVRDSKALTDPRIIEIAKEISKILPYSLLTLPNEKYNRLVEKGYTQTKLKAVLHNQAQLNVIQKLNGQPFDGCLIDQFTPPAQYFKAIHDRPEKVSARLYFKTKAESLHYSVAASSIIARYAFLKAMDQLSEKAGMELPKGAGPGVDRAAAQLIKNKGEDFLNQVAKVHFANTEKAKRLI